jgi:hypothetical protein
VFLDLKLKKYVEGYLTSDPRDIASFIEKQNKKLINLEKYLLDENSILDADMIQSDIFPMISADVFVSHSHSDQEGAIEIALALERIGLTAFVDSCVWGFADDLLRKIDDKFCIPKGWSSYSYDLRNRTTTNVHLILSSALQGMIDQSELFIFLESGKSVKVGEYVNKPEYLSSPWIHSELMFASRVRRKERKRISSSNESIEIRKAEASTDIGFAFNVPESTKSMDFFDFATWLKEFPRFDKIGSNAPPSIPGLNHLDRLYKRLGVDNKNFSMPRWEAY